MGRSARIGLGLLAVVALAACQGRVTDPEGDVNDRGGPPAPYNDIVEAGADHTVQTTRLWIRYAEGGAPAQYKTWLVSVDGDTEVDLSVHIGGGLQGAASTG